MATGKSSQITLMSQGLIAPGALHRTPTLFTGALFTKPASGAGATANDIIRLCRLWSSDIILAIEFETAAWGASGVMELGLYDTEENNDGAVLDADFFASAVDVSAAVAKTDLLRESTTVDAYEHLQPLWQAYGLTSDPRKWMDLVAFVTHPGAAQAAKFSVGVRFVQGA